ncbi:MAG TPA: TSUP family transporter [Devosia sp.]|nr:TSUP family transporter [Devosia sp.]
MTLDPLVLLALAGVGALAGFVDAIGGGGGLIALPALLAAGVPPITALGTNKVQSVIGTGMAALTYWRGGFISFRDLVLSIVVTFIAACFGAWLVKQIDISILKTAVPVALIVMAAYFLFAPRLTDESRHTRLAFPTLVPVLGATVGFYDGAFGPGTGTFLTVGFVVLFGLGLTRAAGHTKILNLTSNLGALAVFIPSGDVLWIAAAAMAVGQFAGGYLGAMAGIRFGARIIRPIVIAVAGALALKLLLFP